MYEQLFTKPKMSEKLLCKPPFRYLHDVYTATMGATGFGSGLFQGEELNSKAFEDKDSKLGFLVKLITLTEMAAGEKIDVKPSMVLAGQQPDKTNLFLQKMFQVATSGIDCTPIIAQILGIGGEEGEGEGQEEGQDEGEGEEDGAAEAAAAAEEEARFQAEAEQKASKDAERAEKKRRQE